MVADNREQCCHFGKKPGLVEKGGDINLQVVPGQRYEVRELQYGRCEANKHFVY